MPLQGEHALASLREEVQLLKAQLRTVDGDVAYVINTVSHSVHLPLVTCGPPILWRTRCGWSFGSVSHFVLIKYRLGQCTLEWPAGTPCLRCMRRAQAAESTHAVMSSDSGSDSH